jgi:hypothetical protein
MKFQTSRLARELGKAWEFTILEGTYECECADPMVAKMFKAPYFQWWDTHDDTGAVSHKDAFQHKRRVWYTGLSESLGRILNEIEQNGPFDLLLGFSQGAMFSTLLTLLFSRRDHPITREISPEVADYTGEMPWNMVCLVAGCKPRLTELQPLMEDGFTMPLPSVHIVGETDFMVELARQQLALWGEGSTAGNGAAQCTLLEHPAGHQFPRANEKELYANWAAAILAHTTSAVEGASGSSSVGSSKSDPPAAATSSVQEMFKLRRWTVVGDVLNPSKVQ